MAQEENFLLLKKQDEYPEYCVKSDCGNCPIYEKQKEHILDSIKFETGFKVGKEIGFREGIKSIKSAELNEEDKEALDMCLDAIPKAWKTKNGVLLTDWLKKHLHPQNNKVNEFEPEEGDILVNKDGVIAIFESWGHHPDGGSFNDKSYFFAKCSLDNGYYNEIDCHPDSNGLRYATQEEIRKLIPYLVDSYKPQCSIPKWKPSEAQKNALKEVLDKANAYGILQKMDDAVYSDIIELQNELEEL